METNNFFENILFDINRSNTKITRRKVKTIFSGLGAKTTSSHKVIDRFRNELEKHNLDIDLPIEYGMSNRQYVNFWIKGTEAIVQKTEEIILSENVFHIPDDFFRNLFEFESDQEYERFHACLNSCLPMAIFLVPQKDDFYSSVVERILSYEIVRKRQSNGDGAFVGNFKNTNFDDALNNDDLDLKKNDDQWLNSDIHSFDEATLESVILGESGKELIESEKFEKQFNQLSFLSNKYNAEDQFFILFKCPSSYKLQLQNKYNNLDKLINKVSAKLPYSFKLKCKFSTDQDLNNDNEVKEKIVNHLKLLFEVPYFNQIDIEDTLLGIYVELQKTQIQAENQLFLNIKPELFQKLDFGNESREHIYLKYLSVKTLNSKPYDTPVTNIETEIGVSNIDEITQDINNARPDVKAETKNKKVIIVEAETMRGKDYLIMTSQIISKGNGWLAYKNFSELWLLLPGYEVARNYYQIEKTIELIKNELSLIFQKNILVKPFSPDLISQQIVEISFEKIYKPTFKISTKLKQSLFVEEKPVREKPILGFANVKGLYEEKQKLNELKELNDNDLKSGIGGILFYGLPGCGKTYIAKAFAQEIGWSFYNFSPGDIVSKFIGETQQKIKDIFKQAKAKSPSVLFIDELDAIAFNRNVETGFGAHTDQKATINQLLIEINNIEEHKVLVIGATNLVQSLDPAIRRTGRFDLKIPIYPPNEKERKEIIEFYLNRVNSELTANHKKNIVITETELQELSLLTKKRTSSDLEAICNVPRIDALLNRDFNSFERLKQAVDDVGSSLKTEEVKDFVVGCEQDRIKSTKLDDLKRDWDITD